MNQNTFIEQGTEGFRHLIRGSIGLAIVTLFLFGLAYSLIGTALGRALFPHAATGSLIERNGKIIGSSLVAQPFVADSYFQPRPSASNYDPMAVSGSNQARSNPDLHQRIDEARATVAAREGIALKDVPSDFVTQSGSGIDPHISPAAAQLQLVRVAKARRLDEAKIGAMVDRYTRDPLLGLFGQSRINVLELNLALDALTADTGAK